MFIQHTLPQSQEQSEVQSLVPTCEVQLPPSHLAGAIALVVSEGLHASTQHHERGVDVACLSQPVPSTLRA